MVTPLLVERQEVGVGQVQKLMALGQVEQDELSADCNSLVEVAWERSV